MSYHFLSCLFGLSANTSDLALVDPTGPGVRPLHPLDATHSTFASRAIPVQLERSSYPGRIAAVGTKPRLLLLLSRSATGPVDWPGDDDDDNDALHDGAAAQDFQKSAVGGAIGGRGRPGSTIYWTARATVRAGEECYRKEKKGGK